MSDTDFFGRFVQKFQGLRLPELQDELAHNNFDILRSYLPIGSEEQVRSLLKLHPAIIKIVNSRRSKAGDFRSPRRGEIPTITLNRDLNPFALLVTFLHEWAHLIVYLEYGNQVKPHGKEWKICYRNLLYPVCQNRQLPLSFRSALKKHMAKPKASTLGDAEFAKFLKLFDASENLHLEDLEEGQKFSLNNGMVMIKGPLRRTRFLCTELRSGRKYTVHGLAEVELYSESE